MKTLKDEIVEALRSAQKTINLLMSSIGGYKVPPQHLSELAAKAESARCENCDFFDQQYPTGCEHPHNEPGFKDGAWMETCGPEFGCWHFEPKEK